MFWMTIGFFIGIATGGVFVYALLTWGGKSSVLDSGNCKREEKGEHEHDSDEDHFLDDLPSFLKRQAE